MALSPSGASPPHVPPDIPTDQARIPAPSGFRPLPRGGVLKVSFLSVKVIKDGSWGVWRDTNWRFDFSVNGEVRSLNKEVNEDDPPFPVNFNFLVDVTAPGSGLSVQVGGRESDWGSSPLPFSVAIWKAENNYGFGIHALNATSQDVSFEATYRIAYVQRKVVSISTVRRW